MFCAECGAEYRDGITRCNECGVDLVAELAPPPPLEIISLVNVAAFRDLATAWLAKGRIEAEGLTA